MDYDTEAGREALRASLLNTMAVIFLRNMKRMGVPRALLLKVIEEIAKEERLEKH